jgi:hypothetical protein
MASKLGSRSIPELPDRETPVDGLWMGEEVCESNDPERTGLHPFAAMGPWAPAFGEDPRIEALGCDLAMNPLTLLACCCCCCGCEGGKSNHGRPDAAAAAAAATAAEMLPPEGSGMEVDETGDGGLNV